MADVSITPIELVPETATGDLVGDGDSVNAAQTFAITLPVHAGRGEGSLIIRMEEEGSGAATVTFDAGDNPPSLLQGKGALEVSLSTSDFQIVVLEPGRHLQNDGTITGSVADNDTFISAYYIGYV